MSVCTALKCLVQHLNNFVWLGRSTSRATESLGKSVATRQGIWYSLPSSNILRTKFKKSKRNSEIYSYVGPRNDQRVHIARDSILSVRWRAPRAQDMSVTTYPTAHKHLHVCTICVQEALSAIHGTCWWNDDMENRQMNRVLLHTRC